MEFMAIYTTNTGSKFTFLFAKNRDEAQMKMQDLCPKIKNHILLQRLENAPPEEEPDSIQYVNTDTGEVYNQETICDVK